MFVLLVTLLLTLSFLLPQTIKVDWWEKATRGTAQKIVEAVREWRMAFMCRREKEVLGKKLPPLERKVINVPVRPSELGVYEHFERTF